MTNSRPQRPALLLPRRDFIRRSALFGGLAVGSTSWLAACGSDDEATSDSAPSTDAASTDTTPATVVDTAAPAAELPTVSYQLSWLPTVEHCGTYIGIDRGYFTEAGIAVDVVPGGPNVAAAANVVSGQTLVGADGADNAGQARAEGAPIKIFAARLQKNPLCIVSLADTPINSPQELIGKTIGVAQGNQVPWQIFLAINGIDESEVEVVPVQYDPAPTANGEVEGQVVFAINEPAQLESQGIGTNTMLFADYGFNIFAGCYFATEETIATRADDLAAFLTGERRGFADNLADPSIGMRLTIDDYGKDLGLAEEQQLLQSELLADVMVTPTTDELGLLALGADDVAANIETLGVAGVEATADDLFTTEILDML